MLHICYYKCEASWVSVGQISWDLSPLGRDALKQWWSWSSVIGVRERPNFPMKDNIGWTFSSKFTVYESTRPPIYIHPRPFLPPPRQGSASFCEAAKTIFQALVLSGKGQKLEALSMNFFGFGKWWAWKDINTQRPSTIPSWQYIPREESNFGPVVPTSGKGWYTWFLPESWYSRRVHGETCFGSRHVPLPKKGHIVLQQSCGFAAKLWFVSHMRLGL